MSAPSVNCTCPVPSKGEPLGGRLGGQPQGEEAELETGQVNQEVGSICDNGKTPRNVATWGVHSITRGEDIMPHTGSPTHPGSPTHNGKSAWKGRLRTLVWGTIDSYVRTRVGEMSQTHRALEETSAWIQSTSSSQFDR